MPKKIKNVRVFTGNHQRFDSDSELGDLTADTQDKRDFQDWANNVVQRSKPESTHNNSCEDLHKT